MLGRSTCNKISEECTSVITADITKALTEKWPEGKDLTEQGKGDYSVHTKINKRLKAIIYMFIFFSSPWNGFC